MIKHYKVYKKNKFTACKFNYNKIKGFNFVPRNNVKYDGIIVNKLLIIKPSLIENILKKKIKRKLDLYFKLIIKFIDTEDNDDGDALREALNDVSRYKSIVEYKYKKYLDQKYLTILLKKISILEYELNSKLINLNEYEDVHTTRRVR